MVLCLIVQPKHPHPGVELSLKTKAQVPFNSLMTALSKPLFPLFSAFNLAEC
jgi:hypothetical protein